MITGGVGNMAVAEVGQTGLPQQHSLVVRAALEEGVEAQAAALAQVMLLQEEALGVRATTRVHQVVVAEALAVLQVRLAQRELHRQ